jgi:hypothetical protein
MGRETRNVLVVILLVICFLSAQTLGAVDYYKLQNIKRVDDDLYKTGDGFYVQTKYCYHYTYGEDALLKWDGPYGDNKVVWADDSTCQVKTFWKK